MHASIAVLSTYPPTQCGLATFSRALVSNLDALGVRSGVVRVVDHHDPYPDDRVVHQMVGDSPADLAAAARALNEFDVALVQHEYGIFPGPDGEHVLGLLADIEVPVISVLHTVLADPSPRQRRIMAGVIAASDQVVVMTRTGRDRVVSLYGLEPADVRVIPHGSADLRTGTVVVKDERPTLLTWGLLGPGKGIEWAIDAMVALTDLNPLPRYIVAGQTHPRVLERDGESYRQQLMRQAGDLGVDHLVSFDDRYMTPAQLHRLVAAADVVVLPYDSREQVTSGVLIEAIAAGKPVISTGFPHAVELLGDGTGIIVPQCDPDRLAEAMLRVLTEPGLTASLRSRTEALAPDLLWPTVAGRYKSIADALAGAPARRSW